MNKSFVKLAAKAAASSTFRQKLGAVLVVNGVPIEVGCNQIRYNNVLRSSHYNNSMHAEMSVIARMIRTGRSKYLKGASLYVVRLMRDGVSLGMAMPCECCMEVMLATGIKRCYYSNSDGLISEIRL